MIKGSTITARDTPVETVSSTAGGLIITAETLRIDTGVRVDLIDITDRLIAYTRQAAVREGMLSVWSMHTTCALFINEFQPALLADIKRFLEQMVPHDSRWLHNDPAHSDCERMNADAHLRAMLLGHHLNLQISGGELVLGQWQRVLAAELDGPRTRDLRVQAWGIA